MWDREEERNAKMNFFEKSFESVTGCVKRVWYERPEDGVRGSNRPNSESNYYQIRNRILMGVFQHKPS